MARGVSTEKFKYEKIYKNYNSNHFLLFDNYTGDCWKNNDR